MYLHMHDCDDLALLRCSDRQANSMSAGRRFGGVLLNFNVWFDLVVGHNLRWRPLRWVEEHATFEQATYAHLNVPAISVIIAALCIPVQSRYSTFHPDTQSTG
jgi:hypothetical protein